MLANANAPVFPVKARSSEPFSATSTSLPTGIDSPVRSVPLTVNLPASSESQTLLLSWML